MNFPHRIEYDGSPETAILNLTTTPLGWTIWGIAVVGLVGYGCKQIWDKFKEIIEN